MNAPVVRLGTRHRAWLYAGLALLWTSGALWLLFHYGLQVDGPFGPERHPLETWWLRLHGLAVILALLLLGSVLPHHARLAWERRRNHQSGLPMLAVFGWLSLSGYALYYFSTDANAAWLPGVHWVPGLLLPVLLAAHVRQARRRRAASGTPHARNKVSLRPTPAVPAASQPARP